MRRQLRAFAEALFSTGGTPPPAARLDWLLRELLNFLDSAGPGPRFVVVLALWVVALLAPLFIFRLSTLAGLPLDDRVRALTRQEESFAAAPVLAVKAFLCVVYYEHPDVQRECGHVGPSTFPMAVKEGDR